MDIKEFCIAHKFDMSKCEIALGGGSFGMADLKTSPAEFLSLAEDDFERGGLAALVNATTNAKRAIVSQLDQLLISFGYQPLRWNVPKKNRTYQSARANGTKLVAQSRRHEKYS